MFRVVGVMMTDPVTEESQLVSHARRELEIVGEDKDVIEGALKILQIISDMGHSGASMGYFLMMLTRLCLFENLAALTNDPNEWMEVGPGVWQSTRNSEAFSSNGGKAYYLLSEREKGRPRKLHTSEDKVKDDGS